MTDSHNSGVLGHLKIPIGLGLLRLASDGRPSQEDAIALIHLALDQGVRLLDTAPSYCLTHKDFHYGETLVRLALEQWDGPTDEVKIITKVGMARPKGKWVPAGSAKDLIQGIDGSLKALGVERLFLVQLHLKDPRVPLEETLETLASLQQQGKIQHLGLCNLGPLEVRQAQRHFEVNSVQNELSVLSSSSAQNGLVELARDLKIPFLAHRPLGGYAKVDSLLKNRILKPLVSRYGATHQEIALRALWDLAPGVIPLVGATRKESLLSSLKAINLDLDRADLQSLQTKFEPTAWSRRLIAPRFTPADLPTLEPGAGPSDLPEVVLITGIQGAGKSETVQSYLQAGYARLNRDDRGGSLADLIEDLDALLASGQRRVVLDNTYPTRVSRSPLITVAHSHGVPVRCRHLNTTVEDATVNVCHRILDRYGKLLGPDEMKSLAKEDPNLPPPQAMKQYTYSFEPPQLNEGFSAVDTVEFQRRLNPEWTNKALFLDVDGTLRVTKSGENYPRHPDDVDLLPGRREVLQTWIDNGYQLFFLSNQSGIHSGKLLSVEAQACFDKTIELLGLPVTEVVYCPHGAFPVACFCRKPLPGLGVHLFRKYRLNPDQVVMVGDLGSDAAFAQGLGIRYVEAAEFFGA